jgi:hypothetical protein
MLTIDYANIRAYTNIINGLTLTYWHWGALARLVLNQLKSLPQDEVNRQVWTVELPFIDKKQAKSLQIQIAEENKKTQQILIKAGQQP